MSTPIRAHVHVLGKVQGVFFRVSAMGAAQRLGLVGSIQNLPDGSVESVVEGPPDMVDEYVAWCRQGPPGARVDDVIVRKSEAKGEFRTFTIER